MHPNSSDISSYEVIYDRSNTDSTLIPMSWNSVGIDDFIIWYSYDFGDSWNALDTVSNTSSYNLYFPNRGLSYSCFISVTDADSDNRPESIFDNLGYGVYVTHDTISPVTPEGGAWIYAGSQQSIEWDYIGTSGNNITLEYSTDKGVNWKHIATTPNDGDYTWDIPAYESSAEDELLIRFRDAFNLHSVGDSLYNLSLVGLTLEYPNGGEVFSEGSSAGFTFTSVDPYAFEVVYAYISINNWVDSVYVGSGGGGEGSWSVPALISTNAKMRIMGGGAYDETDFPFEINSPGK